MAPPQQGPSNSRGHTNKMTSFAGYGNYYSMVLWEIARFVAVLSTGLLG